MILTNVGMAKIANAQLTDETVDLTTIAVGDGGGAYYNPVQTATALKNEVWRGNIHAVSIDDDNPNWIIVEGVIPSAIGGFTIREIGLFDSTDLIAIGKVPETYKPAMEEGSSKDLYLKSILEVSNASAVTLKVDPAVILASRKYVDDKIQIVSTNLANVQQQLATHLDDSKKWIRATKTSNQSIVSGTSSTAVTFEILDKHNDATFAVLDNTTKTIKISESGIYEIVARIYFAGNSVGERSLALDNYAIRVTSSGASGLVLSGSTFVQLSVGAELACQVSQTSGGALDVLSTVTQLLVRKVVSI